MPSERRQPPPKGLVLAICCLALLISTMDNTVVNVALPALQRSLHASSTDLQWVVDGYVLVVASSLLTAGALGDRFGRKAMFQSGLVLFAAGSLACSLAPSIGLLVLFRILQGIGGSALTPSTMSIITNVYTDPADRARAIGFWAGTSGLAVGLGPIVGGALVVGVGWRAVFWVNLPICALALLASHRVIPESRSDRPRRLDLGGQLSATVAVALVTYGLIEAPGAGWTSIRTVLVLAAAAAAGFGFVIVERRSAQPLIDLGFFRNPPFSAAVLVAFIAFVGLFAFIFFNTLYLQVVLGDSAFMAGVLILPQTGLMMLLSPFSGRLTARLGPRVPTTAACALAAAGLFLLLLVTPAAPMWRQVLGYVVLGIAFGLVNPPVTNAAVSGMPRQQAGVASATAGTARQLGGVFGVALIGSVVFSEFGSELAARGLPGSSGGGLSLHLAGLAPHARQLVGAAFVHAIHDGYVVAGCLCLLAGVVAAVAMAPGPSARGAARLAHLGVLAEGVEGSPEAARGGRGTRLEAPGRPLGAPPAGAPR